MSRKRKLIKEKLMAIQGPLQALTRIYVKKTKINKREVNGHSRTIIRVVSQPFELLPIMVRVFLSFSFMTQKEIGKKGTI